jgi:Phosphotransferase enzyme family
VFAPTETGHGTDVWASAWWLGLAVAWLDEQLAAAGTERAGEIEQTHLRPWGTVLRAPTANGPVWLKAAAPNTAFEVRLYALLQRVAPEHVLDPIAVDVDRGWVLLPDGGPPLGESLNGAELAEAMTRALPQYAQFQRVLAPHAEDLLALGVADMRPEVMSRRFGEALEAVCKYVERRGSPDDRQTHARVAALSGTFVSWCERLEEAPGSASLDHNDLHPYNILVDVHGRARFYDWGDAVVAHPFASLLLPLGWLRYKLGFGLEDPAFLRARDAYLEVFSDLAPRTELVETLALACQVGKVARALTWERAVRELPAEGGEHEEAPLACLAALLDDSYLGGA